VNVRTQAGLALSLTQCLFIFLKEPL